LDATGVNEPQADRAAPHGVLFVQSGAAFAADAQVHASIARFLPALGFEVTFACNPGAPGEPSPSFVALSSLRNVTTLPADYGPRLTSRSPSTVIRAAFVGGVREVRSLARLRRYVRDHGIGVVHCTEKIREASFAYALARSTGAAFVVHLHLAIDDWFSRPVTWLLRRADRLIAVSDYVAASAVNYGYDPARVAVARNGWSPHVLDAVELSSPAELDALGGTTRAELGIQADALVVAIVARLNPWKGHRTLFDAIARLDGEGLGNVQVIVAGDDGTGTASGPVAQELRAHTTRLGIVDRVHFVGFREDPSGIFAACDVFAMPCVEPFGLVYLEAMAAGKPVLALSVGGAPEVVEDGVTGLLSAEDDAAGLAANLRLLAEDEALRARLGLAGRRRVEREFSASRMAADVAEIYAGLS
jgi:glycosyltransferase involved in cell wall biosynthesis